MHVIALGHDKKMFDRESRAFARQVAYAKELSSFHVFIPTSKMESQLVSGQLTIHPVVGKNVLVVGWKVTQAMYRQLRACQQLGPTVLIVQSPFEFGLLGLLLSRITRVPLQVQVHGDFYSGPYWRTESWGNRIRATLGLFVLRRAAGIRVVSKRIAVSLEQRGVDKKCITVLPIESDVSDFLLATAQPIWPTAPGLVTVLSVGRFAREKNLPLLIKAFYEMWRVHPQTQLVLIGEGPAESSVRKLVTSLWPTHAPVRLYPWQTHIASLMMAADIYALSSDHEGYAMVLGEALAAGVPVVTTDVGCAGELVLPDVHGLIVPTRDVEAYTSALSRLVSDTQLRTRYGMAGVETMSRCAQSGDTYTKSLVATWRSLVK